MAGLCELVLEPRFLRRIRDAVDGGVTGSEATDNIGRRDSAANVVRLAEEKENAAGGGWLLLEEIDAHVDGVEDSGASVARLRVGKGVGEAVDARRKVPDLFRLAIKGNECDTVGGTAHHVLKQRCEVAVVRELTRSRRTGLHEDDDGEGLAGGVFDRDDLRDAIIGEAEVLRAEAGDEIAGERPDQGGGEDEGGRGSDRRCGPWRRLGRRERGRGKKQKEESSEVRSAVQMTGVSVGLLQ